jgi:hypothetical protein
MERNKIAVNGGKYLLPSVQSFCGFAVEVYLHRLFIQGGGDIIITFQLIEPAHVIVTFVQMAG